MKIILLFFLLLNSILYAEKVGGLFDVEAVNNEINIKSKVMTYYYARYVSEDETSKSSPTLVQRNTDKITLDIGDFKLKWDGAIPVPEYDEPNQWLKFSSNPTSLGSFRGWENATIEFQGGGLRNINTSWSKSKYDTITLGLLNLSVLPELIIKSLPKKPKISQDTPVLCDKAHK